MERRELASGLGTNVVVLDGGLRRLFLRETASVTLARIQHTLSMVLMYVHFLAQKTYIYHMSTRGHEKVHRKGVGANVQCKSGPNTTELGLAPENREGAGLQRAHMSSTHTHRQLRDSKCTESRERTHHSKIWADDA